MDGDAAGAGIQILGVNAPGLESGNEGMCDGRKIPWLQDTDSQAVWTRWAPVFRDVVILDRQNRVIGTYNLTVHSLSRIAAYDSLKTMLLDAAAR